MKIDVKALPVFEVFEDGGQWGIRTTTAERDAAGFAIGTKQMRVFPLSELHARLFAASSPMIRFLSLCYRPGRPLYADLQTLFGHCGLELPEPAGADVRPTTKGE